MSHLKSIGKLPREVVVLHRCVLGIRSIPSRPVYGREWVHDRPPADRQCEFLLALLAERYSRAYPFSSERFTLHGFGMLMKEYGWFFATKPESDPFIRTNQHHLFRYGVLAGGSRVTLGSLPHVWLYAKGGIAGPRSVFHLFSRQHRAILLVRKSGA